jgi:ferredoxin
MKANVNKETCIGCELCVSVCPDVFAMVDGVAVAGIVPDAQKEQCEEAAKSCPVEAITITE